MYTPDRKSGTIHIDESEIFDDLPPVVAVRSGSVLRGLVAYECTALDDVTPRFMAAKDTVGRLAVHRIRRAFDEYGDGQLLSHLAEPFEDTVSARHFRRHEPSPEELS